VNVFGSSPPRACKRPAYLISQEKISPQTLLIALMVFTMSVFFTSFAGAAEKQGNLVLSFDDGYPSWIKTIAPELAKAGGVATGYVNNFRIRDGVLSYEDLRELQNRYGWEIGSHTFNHFDPTLYIELHGLTAWERDELDASINGLRAQGLKVNSLVFPFNKSSAEIRKEVLKRVGSFRRIDKDPLSAGIDRDGSFPGRAIDIEHYVPLKMIYDWIDEAHRTNSDLFLYGHRVLADSEFREGVIKSVKARSLTAAKRIAPLSGTYQCLVPDRKKQFTYTIMITGVEGAAVSVSNGDLTALTKPGAAFIIGPCMATRLSDFRKIMGYAAKRLNFLTVSGATPDRTAASSPGQ
jgi:peptidoglycan/xylan/chitin deacetylase (PgdA/CDA1 family)